MARQRAFSNSTRWARKVSARFFGHVFDDITWCFVIQRTLACICPESRRIQIYNVLNATDLPEGVFVALLDAPQHCHQPRVHRSPEPLQVHLKSWITRFIVARRCAADASHPSLRQRVSRCRAIGHFTLHSSPPEAPAVRQAPRLWAHSNNSCRDGTLRISGVGGNPRRGERATPAVGHTTMQPHARPGLG